MEAEPATSNLAPGVAVPIPTFPVPRIVNILLKLSALSISKKLSPTPGATSKMNVASERVLPPRIKSSEVDVKYVKAPASVKREPLFEDQVNTPLPLFTRTPAVLLLGHEYVTPLILTISPLPST